MATMRTMERRAIAVRPAVRQAGVAGGICAEVEFDPVGQFSVP
jgi:hypothetical protein